MVTSQTVLGIDYGVKRLGVAVGQTITGTANPLTTLTVRQGLPDWREFDRIVRNWSPDYVVVGLPVHQDGTEHELAPAILRFVAALRERYDLDVNTIDERLSSHEAQQRLLSSKRGSVDAYAAQLILETWFSERSLPTLETNSRLAP